MTTDNDELLEGGPEQICAQCGHAESAHLHRDHELPGQTVQQTYCEMCDDEHDFVPAPD